MMYVTITLPDGQQHTTITRKWAEANAAYWQALNFSPPHTEVEAHGFIPRRSNGFKCFSFGKRESAMHEKHEAVVPKNARLVGA